ncbi:hypothetical protein AB1Y20_008784 [Prymnesium parvum]|uniref:Nucleotide-diphospho-sugar transferase domain-containing protein n=1 Tax=Prymnesium parvum TaxID=97485 RepID=A0AB34IU66_PRYPA
MPELWRTDLLPAGLRCHARSNDSAACAASRVHHEPCRYASGKCRTVSYWASRRDDDRLVFLRRVGQHTPTVPLRLPPTWAAFVQSVRLRLLADEGEVAHIFLADGTAVEPSHEGLRRLPDRATLYVSVGESFSGLRTNPYLPLPAARRFRAAVRLAVRRRSDCVPGRGVMLSVADRFMGPLRRLALSRVARLDCLMARFVSLCLGGWRDGHGDCVDAAAPSSWRRLHDGGRGAAPRASRIRWSSAEYHRVTWAKWSLMHLALFEASYALCVDADVALLHNPFARVDLSLVRGRALLIQEEMANCAAARHHTDWMCGRACRMNSGVFFSSSPDLSREVVQRLYPLAITERTWVDQDIVKHGLKNMSYTSCRLPGSFAGHCSVKYGVRLPPPCELVTYHPTCLRNASEKLEVVRALLRATESCEAPLASRHAARIHERAHCCRMKAQQVLPLLPTPGPDGAPPRAHGAPRRLTNATFAWCEQQCVDQPDCRYFSYSSDKANELMQRNVHELVDTLPDFGMPVCALCAHCDMLPGGTYSSWRMRRDWQDQALFL